MSIRKSLICLGVAGTIALATSAAFAQGGYPGYPGMGGGGYPGSMGGYPGGMSGYPGAASGMNGTAGSSETVTTTTATTPTGTLPKGGGDPLSVIAAGSMLLSAGFAVRRRARGR
ncbi:MAG TPA: hypothetical protein VFJ58_12190 [Armatimonadota bacterium]|nr:hypothetical protein [Armatimonadota bacterium]